MILDKHKLNYLNIACGHKYHPDWVNIDIITDSKYVHKINILKGLPFPDDTVEVIYNSQFIEHLTQEEAANFLKECFRVLKKDGILRIVTPDLENIVNEYKNLLAENLNTPSPVSKANYNWILLELFDQMVRTRPGGNMLQHLLRPDLINRDYIIKRTGLVGKEIFYKHSNKNIISSRIINAFSSWPVFIRSIKYVINATLIKTRLKTESTRLGQFRRSGEIHQWLYDRFSLPELLKSSGFSETSIKDPFTSDIPEFNKYQLDVKNGEIYDPTSLFVEAIKRV